MAATIEASRRDPLSVGGPAVELDAVVATIDQARTEVGRLIGALPDSTPMFAVVDIAVAADHLRAAVVLLDKAADAIEADQRQAAAAVQR